MLNQETIEKSYYQLLMPGHYIDVKTTESDWKLAKINDKDNRCLAISFDGLDHKQQHTYIHSTRIAPIRFHTEGYTGSSYRAYRVNTVNIGELQNYLEILNKKFLQLPEGLDGIAFELTQYIRGQFFVKIHALLAYQNQLTKQQIMIVINFLQQLIKFISKALDKALSYAKDIFEYPMNNKYLYLAIPRIAFVYSLQQILILLCYITKIECPRNINLLKNHKQISTNELIKLIQSQGIIKKLATIVSTNDNNGRWYPIGVRKQALKLLIKLNNQNSFPKYFTKDFAQAFLIYPFMIELEQLKSTQLQYIQFMINMLTEQSPFDAKLKSLQQIRKILQKDVKLKYFQPINILQLLTERGVLEYMLDEFNFNPQIFKRFVPILSFYCKTKSLTQKQISSLFKLASSRHQSQMNTIYEIIAEITDIAPVDSLDSIFTDISSLQLNSDQTIIFIKNFTIKAVKGYSKSKSFFGSLLGRKPISSKYSYYGLNLFWKEIQDNGRITSKFIPITMDMIRLIFLEEIFHSERSTYMGNCVGLLEKKKSFGQSIKFLSCIINSYPINAYIGDTRKDIIEKMDSKYNLVQTMIKGIKSSKSISFQKVSLKDTLKYFYDFLEEFSEHLQVPLRIQHIQYLWTQGEVNYLMQFIKKTKPTEYMENWRRKYCKRLDSELIKDIFLKITSKKSFYERDLTQIQYNTVDQLFLSYHLMNKTIDINDRGTIRYNNVNYIGKQFYLNVITKSNSPKIQESAIKRFIDLHIRPKTQEVDLRVKNWKKFLLSSLEVLFATPEKCVKFLQAFLTMIEGKQFRENVQHPGNYDIVVQHEGVQKTISIARNCTIFRLRKMIMQSFDIKGDFIMHNLEMKKQITFVEQQDFSVNAMSYKLKGPSIVLKNHRQQEHPQFQSLKIFKEQISNEDKLYNKLFEFINGYEQIQKEVWSIIETLPVNKTYIRKLKNCEDFKRNNWEEFINSKHNQELVYSLNIILELMKSNEWTENFYKSEGFNTISQLFLKKIKQVNDETLLIKLTKIVLKVLEIVDIKMVSTEQIINQIQAIIGTMKQWFNKDQEISMHLLNNILKLLIRESKMVQLHLEPYLLEQNLILKLIEYGIFHGKDVSMKMFSYQTLLNLVLTCMGSLENRIQIINKLVVQYLNIEYLSNKKSTENYFLFLIQMLHSITKQQQQKVFSSNISKTIQNFINEVLNGDFSDSSKSLSHQFNSGALRLINYQLNSSLKFQGNTFQKMVSEFLFKEQNKRLKSIKNRKILYEIMKKVIYANPEKIKQLTTIIAPRLQKAKWRKNNYISWCLQPEKNQKKLFCGLQNLMATCYINSLFQQLFMLKHFRDGFIGIDSQGYRLGQAENEIFQIQQIFATLKYSSKKSCNTKAFCDSFLNYQGRPIDPSVQSDADQFFNALMEKIETFLKQKNCLKILEETFQGKLSNQLNCQGCPHKSQKLQNFLSIGVNIKNKKSLNQALQGFVDGEILDGDNAYYCELCSKKVRTTKRLCINQVPNVLVIVLKRFQFNYDEMRRIKINHELKYPQQLCIKQYTSQYLAGQEDMEDENFTYNLRGVVVHSGTSEGGHYYSFIKDDEKWFEFNDDSVSETTMKRVEEEGFGGSQKDEDGEFKMEKYRNAYILFYQKKNKIIEKQAQVTPFYKQMRDMVLANNSNEQFLSLTLDPSFIRFCQNMTMIDTIQASKFALLFFHTVVLRDKNRDEYTANIYRMLDTKLDNVELSNWFVKQVNYKFIKQFYIEAPKIVKYLSLGLLIKAVKVAQQLPQSFIQNCIFCLGRKGMTPFAKIFTVLSKEPKYREQLIEFQYDKRVLNYLVDKKVQLKAILCESTHSQFGNDHSEKDKDLQFCSQSLIQSLTNFEVEPSDSLKLLQTFSSRVGNKVAARLLAKKSNSLQDVKLHVIHFQKRVSTNDYKREDIEKYMFLIRYYCEIQDDIQEDRIKACIKSICDQIVFIQNTFDPFDLLLSEINKLASRYPCFAKLWRSGLEQSPASKSITSWIKQCDRPTFLSKNEEWKRKVFNMTYNQKVAYQQSFKMSIQAQTKWMFNKIQLEGYQLPNTNSDIELSEEGSNVTIGSKKLLIKEHMGLLTKVEYDKQNKWCILERNQIDLYQWL